MEVTIKVTKEQFDLIVDVVKEKLQTVIETKTEFTECDGYTEADRHRDIEQLTFLKERLNDYI